VSATRLDNNDRRLERFWHPVARTMDLGDGPLALMLLGQSYVAARLDDRIVVFEDRCPHRGAPLSAGTAAGRRLICAYHGFAFDADGTCVSVPGSSSKPPDGARLRPPFAVSERYGLVWIAPRRPASELPDVPEFQAVEPGRIFRLTDEWRATATQIMDNFVDVAHFPVVHRESFGHAGTIDIEPPATVSGGFKCTVRTVGRRVIGGLYETRQLVERELRYRFFAPFSMLLEIRYVGINDPDRIFLALQPVSTERTVVHKIVVRRETEMSAEERAREATLQRQVTDEDKAIVERLPVTGIELSGREEVHIDLDAPTLALRQALVKALSRAENDDGL
jgi:phenylpropionate dioxygenase-like ring-hydroxylating dioxygenase large terminal subunit